MHLNNCNIYITQRRLKLVDLVITQDISLLSAAKRLDLKLSTARHIIKKYREGKILDKKMNKKIADIPQSPLNANLR